MCFCHKNLCECISLSQRAQSYRDAEFYGAHRMHRLTQNFCFSQRARRGRGVLCEFCVFCVRIKICPYALLSQKLCGLLYSASFAWYEKTLCPHKTLRPYPSAPSARNKHPILQTPHIKRGGVITLFYISAPTPRPIVLHPPIWLLYICNLKGSMRWAF